MKTLDLFKERFIKSGRLFSELTSKKQRVTGKRHGYFYVALYDRIQNRWALVMNNKARYPCYTLTEKGEPLAIYVDMVGNIRERSIKQEIFNEILETSEGSQDFRDNLRSSQQILKENFTIEFIKPSLGYNLEGLPYSCQKGKGEFFKWCDDLGKMALLKNNKGNIVGRCLIWYKDHIRHNGKLINNNIADRLYYNEGHHKIALINELKKLGIESMWEQEGQDDIPFEYGEFTLHLTEEIQEKLDEAIGKREAPFLDTFNHYEGNEGILYSWYWVNRLSHRECEWREGITEVLLHINGDVWSGEDEVWDGYNECYIDGDYAVEPLNYDGTTHTDNCIYSEYHNGYLLEDGDIIAVNCDNGYDDYDYTYLGSGAELVEINGEVYFLDNVRRWRA